jgi:hypothetical protein
MTINVNIPSASVVTKVALSSTANSSRSLNIITSNSKQTTATTIGQLQGVDVTQVEDGYTLLYNSASGNWEASPFSASLGNLDGGSF